MDYEEAEPFKEKFKKDLGNMKYDYCNYYLLYQHKCKKFMKIVFSFSDNLMHSIQY